MTDYIPKARVAICNNIIYAYYFMNSENVNRLYSKQDELHFQHLLATNFIKKYLVNHYILLLPASEVKAELKGRLNSFIQQLNIEKYVAILDLNGPYSDAETAVIHLLTDTSPLQDLNHLSDLWGDIVNCYASPFDEVMSFFTKAFIASKEQSHNYFFASEPEKPKILLDWRARCYLYKPEACNADCINSYEINDAIYGRIHVYECINLQD